MSASNEWTEWHLTPRGWERGTEKMDFGNTIKRDPPSDRVLTVTFSEYLGSVHSKPKLSTVEDWRSDDAQAVEELEKRYGPAPNIL
jgi:hypothetical protein